jgi:hypothetical protein
MTSKKTHQVSLKISEAEYNSLKKLAVANGMSVSDFVRHTLMKFLNTDVKSVADKESAIPPSCDCDSE